MADGVTRRLDPRWISLQRLHGFVFTAIVTAASFMTIVVSSIAGRSLLLGLLLLPVWAVAIAALAWHSWRWPAVVYGHASYRVDESGLEIHRGVYWRTITSVPRSRIQHTDVSQGPLERRYGLGTLLVYTAGTQHSEVKLTGLELTVARGIRAHLLPSDDGDAV
jgi:membrane protein YdbS with pleckstrin-like domain